MNKISSSTLHLRNLLLLLLACIYHDQAFSQLALSPALSDLHIKNKVMLLIDESTYAQVRPVDESESENQQIVISAIKILLKNHNDAAQWCLGTYTKNGSVKVIDNCGTGAEEIINSLNTLTNKQTPYQAFSSKIFSADPQQVNSTITPIPCQGSTLLLFGSDKSLSRFPPVLKESDIASAPSNIQTHLIVDKPSLLSKNILNLVQQINQLGGQDNHFTNDLNAEKKLAQQLAGLLHHQPTLAESKVISRDQYITTASSQLKIHSSFHTGSWEGQVNALSPINQANDFSTVIWQGSEKIHRQPSSEKVIFSALPSRHDSAITQAIALEKPLNNGLKNGLAADWAVHQNPIDSNQAINENISISVSLDETHTEDLDNLRQNNFSAYVEHTATAVIDFLGDRNQPSPAIRQRPVLGDSVNSTIAHIPSSGMHDYRDSDYQNFLTNIDRDDMLYFGSNDGLFRGLNANSGEQFFAFTPYTTLSKLKLLMSPKYSHRALIDGQSSAADVKLDTQQSVEKWNTILVNNLGAGGRGVFALDVTNQHNSAPSLLWEINNQWPKSANQASATAQYKDLGHGINPPLIVRLQDAQQRPLWRVVFANGVYNLNDRMVMYSAKPQNGALSQAITLDDNIDATNPRGSGSTSVSAVDIDADGFTDRLYVADSLGRIWRLDWQPQTAEFTPFHSNDRAFFQAKVQDHDNTIVTQAISTQVLPYRIPGQAQSRSVLLIFGSGNKFDLNARPAWPTRAPFQQNSLYAVWDKDQEQQTIQPQDLRLLNFTRKHTSNNNQNRYLTAPSALNDFSNTFANFQGWRIDLPNASEAVFTMPRLLVDSVLFQTILTPITESTKSPCRAANPSGYLIQLDPLSGTASADSELIFQEANDINVEAPSNDITHDLNNTNDGSSNQLSEDANNDSTTKLAGIRVDNLDTTPINIQRINKKLNSNQSSTCLHWIGGAADQHGVCRAVPAKILSMYYE